MYVLGVPDLILGIFYGLAKHESWIYKKIKKMITMNRGSCKGILSH